MRFLVDMPLSPELAVWLRAQGHDAFHATEIGMHRAPDTDILKRAESEGRTVVTADLDFPRLLALTQANEPSLILFRGGNWSDVDVVRRMQVVLASANEADITQSILVVDRDRIRRRRLPIRQ